MNRETMLAGGIVAVVAVSLVAVAVVPGALAETESDPVRPGHLSIQEVAIAPGEVSGGTATLQVDTRLAHSDGTSENVTVRVRAVHLDSGLVETTSETAVPTITGEREVSVVQNLSVERSGGYRIETVVYRDGARIAQGSKEVRGVGTLTPEYARTSVRFHWRGGDGHPPVEYTVKNAESDRVTLDVSTYLTNEGDAASEELRVVFTARQADSNVVADRTAVAVGTVRPGRTATPSVELTVPDGYNYYLDAVLWKDGVIVGTTRSVANLNPTETVRANETVREVGIEVSDFEGDGKNGRGAPETTVEGGYAADSAGSVPGFGVGAAAVALGGALLLARRQS
ncbi:PGF-CTERM sorting domain-containing protein [Halorussus limi]|uniref:PGF-CTERM sorting domain-containing protein n=1 Tax=Halorussus limi TaxID=2938695 RepID=A0A8U0HV32_9EURY|nr:PGF-CTERM sorting domain-containing protein [Halorussus limi]UPV74798.1 PGF-CTERM sorting domain-containing protein [Halorussus limi]